MLLRLGKLTPGKGQEKIKFLKKIDKFKELTEKEILFLNGGNMRSDFLAGMGYYAHKVWCNIKKAYYDGKKINNIQEEESVFSLWGF